MAPLAARDTIIIAKDDRKVCHLKRTRNGKRIDVSVWYDGDMYHPTVRGMTPNRPWRLSGSTRYTPKIAASWLKSLAKTDYTGFRSEVRPYGA